MKKLAELNRNAYLEVRYMFYVEEKDLDENEKKMFNMLYAYMWMCK